MIQPGQSKKVGDYILSVEFEDALELARQACADFLEDAEDYVLGQRDTSEYRRALNKYDATLPEVYSSAVAAVGRLNQFRSEFLEAQR